MELPDGFNVAKFLYYNPELTAYSNITTNTQAYEWAYSNDITNMIWDDSSIPTDFNSEAFILDYKKHLNASRLNGVIRNAMIIEGFTPTMLTQRAKYIATIYQDVLLESSNVFKFNHFPATSNDQFFINNRNLSIGDHVKLMHNVTKIFEYAVVADVIDSERMALSNAKKIYNNIGDYYLIVGIRLNDYVRLAKINYLRGLDPPPNVPSIDALGFVDPTFNPDLYRLLYPDAKSMSDIKSYYDYLSRRDNNDKRIGRVQDIPLDSNVFTPAFDYLSVNYRLTIAEYGALRWGNNYVYGVSEDNVTKSRLLNPSQDQFITEYAIKKYIDRSYEEVAIFNDVVVNGSAIFEGATIFNGPLTVNDLFVDGIFHARSDAAVFGNFNVDGMSTLSGGTQIVGESNYLENVIISNATHTNLSHFIPDVYMNSNLYVSGFTLGPRIGIGPTVPFEYSTESNGYYDTKMRNAEVLETLTVGESLAENTLALRVYGFVLADNVNNVSDLRLKNIDGYVDGADALAAINALEPIFFSYKDASSTQKCGLLADQVAELLPYAVTKLSKYETLVNFTALVGSEENTLEFQNAQGYKAGDELHIAGFGWVKIATTQPNTTIVKLANYITGQRGREITIDKLQLRDVKTIDYPSIIATMCSAIKHLSTQT